MKTRQAIVTAALLMLVVGLAIGCSFFDVPPVASFTFHLSQSVSPCTVAFDASASRDPDGIIVKYAWSFGDEASGTDCLTSHVYRTSGTYAVTLVVTDDDGKTGTARETIVVQRPYSPALAASFSASPSSGPAPLVVVFDAIGSYGHIASYDWDFGDGSMGTGVRTSHTYHTSGTYTARLTVTSIGGATDSTTQTIQVREPGPHATLVAFPTSGAAPLTVRFDGSGSTAGQGSIASHSWNFGDGATGSGVVVDHTYTTAGSYTARLTVVDNAGATGSATQTIRVGEAPPPGAPHAALVASPTFGTAPLTVQFDASGSSAGQGSIVSYAWNLGDGASATGVAVSHVYANVGTYTARLTVTDTSGATDSVTQSIQVAESGPTRPPVTFSGTGDSATASFLLSEGLATFTIRHSGASNFIVWLNAAGEHVDLLVNVIGSYSGTALVGVGAGPLCASPGAHVLSVSADGNWEIRIQQPAYTSGATPPQSYGSTGDSVAGPFELREGLATFEITHTGQSNFNAWLYNTSGAPEDLLVNEIGSYSGTTLVGVRSGGIGGVPGVHVLEVRADGPWQIAVRQPQYTSGAALPWNCSGSGDNVTSSVDLPAGTIEFTLTHNGSSNFIVWLYSVNGKAVDLLANEIGPYGGSKLVQVQAGSYGVSPGLYVMSVGADGNWSVAVRRR